MTKPCQKLISLLLVIATVFTLVTFNVAAFTSNDEIFDLKTVTADTVEITNYDQSSKNVVIPETVTDSHGKTYTVVSINLDTFGDAFGAMVESLTIPGTVKTIKSAQFQNFTALKTLTLNEGVETIGNSAFSNCTSLETLIIPDSVKNLGSFAFGDCSALKSVVIGSGITNIPSTAFDRCTALETVHLGKNVKSVDDTAFRGCSSLTDIYAYGDLETFPLDSIDIDNVTFHCYPDSPLYDFLMANEALIETYPVEGLLITVVDEQKQLYAKTDAVELTKDGIKVEAVYDASTKIDVTAKCVLSTNDDFTTAGEKIVTVTYGEKTATFTVKVYEFAFNGNPQDITIIYKTANKLELLTTDMPEDATIIWSTSNPKVLTVDAEGNLKTLKRGTATITATIDGTDTSVSCNVTVKYKWWQWILIIVLFGWIWYR